MKKTIFARIREKNSKRNKLSPAEEKHLKRVLKKVNEANRPKHGAENR